MSFFFLMIRRPPRSTLDRSSAASDVYKRQIEQMERIAGPAGQRDDFEAAAKAREATGRALLRAVSYTHLRANETVLDIVCRLLLEKKQKQKRKEVRPIA